MLQEKSGMWFAIQPKELFPGKLSWSSSRRQCDTTATEAGTVQRVVHSGTSDLGLSGEDEPEQSKHKRARQQHVPKLLELVPSGLCCHYLCCKTKSTISSLAANTVSGCVDKLQSGTCGKGKIFLKNKKIPKLFTLSTGFPSLRVKHP